jgi:threonine/homoserine/homoserine lactone efflux protein
VQKLISPDKLTKPDNIQEMKTNHIFIQSTLVGILNPKAALFFLAFVTQFIDTTSGSSLTQILILGFIWILMGMVVGALYSILAGSVRNWVSAKHRILKIPRFLAGGIYIALGIAAAFSGSSRK